MEIQFILMQIILIFAITTFVGLTKAGTYEAITAFYWGYNTNWFGKMTAKPFEIITE